MKKTIILVGLIILSIIAMGCETYEITCYDADNPEKVKIWREVQPQISYAKESAMDTCHNGINDIVIKVKEIEELS